MNLFLHLQLPASTTDLELGEPYFVTIVGTPITNTPLLGNSSLTADSPVVGVVEYSLLGLHSVVCLTSEGNIARSGSPLGSSQSAFLVVQRIYPSNSTPLGAPSIVLVRDLRPYAYAVSSASFGSVTDASLVAFLKSSFSIRSKCTRNTTQYDTLFERLVLNDLVMRVIHYDLCDSIDFSGDEIEVNMRINARVSSLVSLLGIMESQRPLTSVFVSSNLRIGSHITGKSDAHALDTIEFTDDSPYLYTMDAEAKDHFSLISPVVAVLTSGTPDGG